MNFRTLVAGTVLCVAFASPCLAQEDKSLCFRTLNFGLRYPNETPVHFEPKFLKTRHRIHSSPTISPNGGEVYWSVFPRTSAIPHRKETILFSKIGNGGWSSPHVAPFSGEYTDGGPFFSANGKRLYFYSKRPLDIKFPLETKGEIWYVEREGEKWGEPQHVKLDLESEKLFFSISDNGNLYFTSGHGRGGTGIGSVDIYCAKFVDSAYAKPERLPFINTAKFVESDPLISPDEENLIFYSFEKPENIGQYDLFISDKDSTGQWTEPVNLGPEINQGYSRFPRIDPIFHFLFFVRQDGVYWVNDSILERMK